MLLKITAIILLTTLLPLKISAKNNLIDFPAGDSTQAVQTSQDLIVAKEKHALDRWKTGDTFGFVDIAADEITYFDPGHEKRCTGKKEFGDWMNKINGTFSFPGYELVDPQVQMHGDIGILTFNFVGFMKDGSKDLWNATEVYALIKGEWKLISSHWSHTKPV